jgi:hypothetical protein
VARSQWRHGDGVVEARRRGVVKHNQSAELKECCWLGRKKILGKNREGTGEYF